MAESGLMYYCARYYDPEIGRFISQDAYTGGPDDARVSYENNWFAKVHGALTLYTAFRQPHRFNRYAYVNNNPTKFTDPTGNTGIAAGVALVAYIVLSNAETAGGDHNAGLKGLVKDLAVMQGAITSNFNYVEKYSFFLYFIYLNKSK